LDHERPGETRRIRTAPRGGHVGKLSPDHPFAAAGVIGAGPLLRTSRIEDPAVQAHLQPWVEMECYQLSSGRHVAQMQSLDLGGMKIVRECQTAAVQKLGFAPADFCSLSMSSGSAATRFSEQSSGEGGTVFFMPGNVEYDVHVPAGVETSYVGFSRQAFLRVARALNPAMWERPPQGVVALPTPMHREFKAIVDLWLSAADAHPLPGHPPDAARLQNHLLQAVLQIAAVPEEDNVPSHDERRRALQIGRAARTFVDDRVDADVLPTVVDICMALGVSERTLQYAFRDYVGMSPVAYLRVCRLNRVRAELASAHPAGTTVTQVAMRFGFLHLGRFAGDYKRLFGMTPSQTLAS
jgi:AraC family transcriptional regulator, ethanolamine operon transcriptional activator